MVISNNTIAGINYFLVPFLLFWFLSQLLFPDLPVLSHITLVISIVIFLGVLLLGSRNDIFLFLFFTTAMSITIPFAPNRELELVTPLIFLLVSVVRFTPKFLRIKRRYTHSLLFVIVVFFVLCLFCVFNGIKIPGINAAVGENSGLLNRFNLLNSITIFIAGLILFDHEKSEQWIKYFFRFYFIVLTISIFVIVLELGPFPFFNTFSWSLIQENEESKKMPIAGIAASFVLMYSLISVSNRSNFLFLISVSFITILISGSRISFLASLGIIFFSFVVRYRMLGKSLIVLLGASFLAFYALLSPLILLVPERYQRLVIIFPPEYYTGRLAHLSESAAASSSSFRQNIWSMASEKIAERPFFGNSFNAPKANYNFEGDLLHGFQQLSTDVLHHDFLVTGSLHNTYFGIAYLVGIPALLLFIFFLFRLTWLHYKISMITHESTRKTALFMSLLLINYLVYATITDLLFDLQFFLTLAVSIKVYLFYYKNLDRVATTTSNP